MTDKVLITKDNLRRLAIIEKDVKAGDDSIRVLQKSETKRALDAQKLHDLLKEVLGISYLCKSSSVDIDGIRFSFDHPNEMYEKSGTAYLTASWIGVDMQGSWTGIPKPPQYINSLNELGQWISQVHEYLEKNGGKP